MKIQIRLLLIFLAFVALAGCKKEPPPPATPERESLLIITSTDVTTFDPQIPFETESGYVLMNIFDTLIEFDATFRLSPGLALRWTNPDDRTWRFYLNPNAAFSDGSRLRASDVKFSIERLKSLTNSELQAFTEHISDVTVVNDTTVDIHTPSPISILNDLVFIPILSQRHVTSAGGKVAESPMGTGPYRLDRWEKGKRIILTQNPHHKPPLPFPRVEFVVSDGSAEERLKDIIRLKPDIAVTLAFRSMDEFKKKAVPDLKIASSHGISVWYLTLNLRPDHPDFKGKNPLSDIRVRKALAHSLDRDEIIRKVLKGYGRPTQQIVAPEIFGYNPDLVAPEFNPEKGRQLLNEAGYENLEIPFYTLENGTHTFENLLLSQWERAGIKGKLVIIKDFAEFNRGVAQGKYTVTLTGYSCTSGDAGEALTFCLHTPDEVRGYGKGNYAGYSNAKVDKITEENLRVIDPRERLALLQKSMQIVAEDLPYLPILIFDDVYVVSDRINWAPPPSGDLRIRSISVKKF